MSEVIKMKSKNETNNPTKKNQRVQAEEVQFNCWSRCGCRCLKVQPIKCPQYGRCNITYNRRRKRLLSSAIALKEGSNIVLYDVAEDLPGVNYPLARESDLSEAREKIELHGVKCSVYKGDRPKLCPSG